MIYLKEFTSKKIVLTDNSKDYIFIAPDYCEFDQDIVEDILDYAIRRENDDEYNIGRS